MPKYLIVYFDGNAIPHEWCRYESLEQAVKDWNKYVPRICSRHSWESEILQVSRFPMLSESMEDFLADDYVKIVLAPERF